MECFYNGVRSGGYCKDCTNEYKREQRTKRKRQDALESGLEPGATRGRIYCISAPGCGQVYVGSTRMELWQRLSQHRRDRRWWQLGRGYFMSSYDVLDHPGAVIRILEECVYVDIQHLRDREAHWIRCHPCVNRYVPGRSQSESHRISQARKVACPGCGKRVRRNAIKRHARSRACSLLAFNAQPSRLGVAHQLVEALAGVGALWLAIEPLVPALVARVPAASKQLAEILAIAPAEGLRLPRGIEQLMRDVLQLDELFA